MKRIGGLFDLIWPRQSLVDAAWRAGIGKRQRREVRTFFEALEDRVAAMSDRIRRGAYTFDSYRTFPVRDTKSRTIHAPTFRDRVAHHAMIGATGIAFERGASPHSYACRRGLGQHAALRQAACWTQAGVWYGKIDVEKFYDSVDHRILLRLLARRFREARLLDLFERLLASYCTAPGRGIPIGALTSQYLGNFLLDEFDRRLRAGGECRRMVRYMDDVVVWGSPASLARVRTSAASILADLGLRMKHGGEWNRCERGVPFLGFVVYPGRVRLGALARRRLRRRFGALERAHLDGLIGMEELRARATSIFAHARHGDDVQWRRTVIQFGRCLDVLDGEDGGEAQEPRPLRSRGARRLLEQHRQEVPLCVPQQEEARQPQQEPGLPRLSGSRHGGLSPPDDAPSRSRPGCHRPPEENQASGTAPTGTEIQAQGTSPPHGEEKAPVGAWAQRWLWEE